MDLSRAWLKDPDRALAALQILSPGACPYFAQKNFYMAFYVDL